MNGKNMAAIIMAVITILPLAVLAHGEEDFAKAEEIIKQKVPCTDLGDDELELLGDYSMELMHPGDAHIQMDEMMGGQDSESLRLMHIRMARAFYCGEHGMMGPSQMGMMMEGQGPMMDPGMMGGPGMMMSGMGMMPASSWMSIRGLLFIAFAAAIAGAIFWLMYTVIVGNAKRRGQKKR